MLFEITHRTTYAYGAGVFLEPQTLRLQPSSDVSQRLLSFSLEVYPAPSGRSDNVDLEGNNTTEVWFSDRTDRLVILTRSTVETLRPNAFTFLWQSEAGLPFRYRQPLANALAPYLRQDSPPVVASLAQEVATASGGDAQAFLINLTQKLHESCRQIRRDTGDPLPSTHTLLRGEGSCRDLTVLMMDACAAQGFASRFVSGYHAEPGADEYDLHAWTEVYIPGGGWRGFDPSTGFAVADQYIALARAANPALAAPISGAYRGRVTAEPSFELSITRLNEA